MSRGLLNEPDFLFEFLGRMSFDNDCEQLCALLGIVCSLVLCRGRHYDLKNRYIRPVL